LGHHSLADKALEINRAGARIARESAGPDRYVLGDIGPCGDFLEPVGSVKSQDLRRMFAEQARGLSEGGSDGIIIETMTALDEMVVAVEAVQSVCSLPVLCSFAYAAAPEGFRTMMGVEPAMVVSRLKPMGVSALGFNCGTLTMDGYIRLAGVYARLLEGTGIILLAEPNAGRPELVDGRACYRLTAQEYAEAVREIHRAGVTILGGCCGTTLGGCCGTTPNHIEAMIRAIRG
jgi:5-methyltetrahydrofolate--homocysteine methyltransferase